MYVLYGTLRARVTLELDCLFKTIRRINVVLLNKHRFGINKYIRLFVFNGFIFT